MLAPLLTRPLFAFAIPGAIVGVWLAWKSVAYPLAFAGIPTLIDAVVGSNPLPKGGVTFLLAAWIGLGIVFAIVRKQDLIASRGLMSLAVAMAFLLLGLMLLRLGPSLGESYGSTKVQLYTADNLVFLIGAVFVGASHQSLRLYLFVTLIVVTAGSLFLLYQLLGGSANMVFNGRFVLAAQEGPIDLGRDSATGVLIAIFTILVASKASTRLWATAVLPVLVVALIAAGSRGPIVAFAFGLVALLALTAATGRARKQLMIVGAGLLFAVIIVPTIVPGSAIGRSLSTIIGSASGLSSNGRSSLWAAAYGEFAKHPLFGLGTGGFAGLNQPEPYPHNILLEVGVELGVVGLIAVTTMIGSMFLRLAALWRWTVGDDRLEASLLIALFVSALINAFFSGAIQDNLYIWVWGGVGLGMYARSGLALPGRGQRRWPRQPVGLPPG